MIAPYSKFRIFRVCLSKVVSSSLTYIPTYKAKGLCQGALLAIFLPPDAQHETFVTKPLKLALLLVTGTRNRNGVVPEDRLRRGDLAAPNKVETTLPNAPIRTG